MKNPDLRWHQRFHSFRKAFGHLRRGVIIFRERDLSDLVQLGAIQTFEFTHELAWKTLKDFLQEQGTIDLFGSKDTTREAFATGLIPNGDAWMAMIESRNQTTHTYNEQTAKEISKAICEVYFSEFESFEQKFITVEQSSSS